MLIDDVSEDITKFYDLTVDDYIKKLSELKKILTYKWQQEKRIECIKVL